MFKDEILVAEGTQNYWTWQEVARRYLVAKCSQDFGYLLAALIKTLSGLAMAELGMGS